MIESQFPGMQKVPLEREGFRLWIAIETIADDRMTDIREMNSDLVRNTGCHFDLKQRQAAGRANPAIPSGGLPSS